MSSVDTQFSKTIKRFEHTFKPEQYTHHSESPQQMCDIDGSRGWPVKQRLGCLEKWVLSLDVWTDTQQKLLSMVIILLASQISHLLSSRAEPTLQVGKLQPVRGLTS